LSTWSPERYPPDTEVAATFFVVNTYLTLIEQLVRDGRSEREIEQIVKGNRHSGQIHLTNLQIVGAARSPAGPTAMMAVLRHGTMGAD